MTTIRTESLYCTEGSANKEYHLEIVETQSGYLVNFRNGARGSAMKTKTKTEAPVTLEVATKLYNSVLKEKLGKGYTPDVSGTAYTGSVDSSRVSGWRAALLKPVDEFGVQALMASHDWGCTEKKDGERRAVETTANGIVGINRKGLYVPVPAIWEDKLGKLPVGTIVDGEHIGDTLYVFDCPQLGAKDLRDKSYQKRRDEIEIALLVHGLVSPNIVLLQMTSVPEQKQAMLAKIAAAHGEGIVLRNLRGTYEEGLSDNSVKFKLYEESTCIVSRVNGTKRSVGLDMVDATGRRVEVGNVTIPANHGVPAVGACVDVRYMHMFEQGSLYQPVYMKPRPDKAHEDATLNQVARIKLKGNGAGADDEAEEDVAQESTMNLAMPGGSAPDAAGTPRRRMKP